MRNITAGGSATDDEKAKAEDEKGDNTSDKPEKKIDAAPQEPEIYG